MTSRKLAVEGFDEVHRVECAGAVAFVALHAVIKGHAFGGIRVKPYADEDAAREDALALARAMSRKVVMAGIEGGGGKAVMIEPPEANRAAAMKALGEFVEQLSGRYCCGPDYGFTQDDGEALREATSFVAQDGLAAATARSVEIALRTASPDPDTVAVQGLGAVGLPLALSLRKDGVDVLAADVHPHGGFDFVDPELIYETPCDVFAPCAHGGVLDDWTIPQLHCHVVCGAANNPLGSDEDADRLHARGILYVPDIVSNCGATIVGASAHLGQSDLIEERMAQIGPRVREILDRAAAEDRSAHHVAIAMADDLIAGLRASASV